MEKESIFCSFKLVARHTVRAKVILNANLCAVLEMLGPHALVEVAVHVRRVVEAEHAPGHALAVLQREVVPAIHTGYIGRREENGAQCLRL